MDFRKQPWESMGIGVLMFIGGIIFYLPLRQSIPGVVGLILAAGGIGLITYTLVLLVNRPKVTLCIGILLYIAITLLGGSLPETAWASIVAVLYFVSIGIGVNSLSILIGNRASKE